MLEEEKNITYMNPEKIKGYNILISARIFSIVSPYISCKKKKKCNHATQWIFNFEIKMIIKHARKSE